MLSNFDARVAYRLVFNAAWRFMQRESNALVTFDGDKPADVERLNRAVEQEVDGQLDGVDPRVVALAIDDAIRGRWPRG